MKTAAYFAMALSGVVVVAAGIFLSRFEAGRQASPGSPAQIPAVVSDEKAPDGGAPPGEAPPLGARVGDADSVPSLAANSYGPIESSFLDGGRINQRAVEVLGSDRFDPLFTRFERENADAVELSIAYREELQGQLAKLPEAVRLERFACGMDLCMGSIRTAKGSTDYRAWYARLQASSRLPIPVLTEAVIVRGEDEEHRILFSTNASTKAIAGFGNGKNP